MPGPRTTSSLYRDFSTHEVRGYSPVYDALCTGIAADPAVLRLLDTLPWSRRQPNLVLACVRILGGPVGDYGAFRAWVLAHWDALAAQVRARRTQTNEARRCATLLPVLAALPGPLALVEVGASAGLCLHPDRYRYRYDVDGGPAPVTLGDGPGPVLGCTLDAAAAAEPGVPDRLPEVVHRAGVDLHPLDPASPRDLAWLDALIWPGLEQRRSRLRQAAAVAAAHPVPVETGDLVERVGALVDAAPPEATVVVFHTAVLAYLTADDRRRFADAVRGTRARWLSDEAPGVFPWTADLTPPDRQPRPFVMALDREPLAWADPHGAALLGL